MSIFRSRALLPIGAALACLAAATFAPCGSAAEPASTPIPTAEAGKESNTETQIGEWIKDLDSDLFATRQSAAHRN